ncbi:uncharacterized protein BYT42DRAFT_237779 [Radiomyces spectabilis]|uniref:uncharacterized protein n=1 Tax=Radiomyces spectabilis TaxID=64574 RepID=UPI00221E43CF|nr:uncharacterized protein BYT42DRAFT_237779 [Radiomyces spectabilis]KAI8388521.1 hypothetical protein BYT42DRAFT_237779 [Radiomyces spectabilis]
MSMSPSYDWVEIVDLHTNVAFFANPNTGECLLEKPAMGLVRPRDPEGDWWELWDDKHQLPYYYNTGTCATEWTQPSEEHIISLIKIQTSPHFTNRINNLDNGTILPTPMEIKRNSRSLDLTATNASFKRTHTHERSTSDGAKELAHNYDLLPPSPETLTPSNTSPVSCVFLHVDTKSSLPVRKTSLREHRDPKQESIEPHRSRRLSYFSPLASLARSAPLKSLVPIRTHAFHLSAHPLETLKPTKSPTSMYETSILNTPILPAGLRQDINQFAIDGFAKKYFATHKRGLFRRRVPMNEMLQWTKDSLKQPLIMLNKGLCKEVLKCFKLIQIIMGDRSRPRHSSEVDEIQTILNYGISKGQMRDEIYVQVCKQLHHNPSSKSIRKGWEILCIISITFPPSKNLEAYLTDFVQQHHQIQENDVHIMSQYVSSRLKRICTRGAKGKVLTPAEIQRAKEAPFKPSVFGESLDFIMNLQTDDELKIPRIVPFLADTVRQLNGPCSEGIFRVPGDADDVTELRVRIENGNYDASGITDPNVPASLLKYWLRDLAEPLITPKFYDQCIAAFNEPQKAVEIINLLPDINRRIAMYMITFLQEFTDPEVIKRTLMNINNLAMVFAPNFLRCPSESLTTVFENSKYEQAFLKLLITNLSADQQECAYDAKSIYGSCQSAE